MTRLSPTKGAASGASVDEKVTIFSQFHPSLFLGQARWPSELALKVVLCNLGNLEALGPVPIPKQPTLPGSWNRQWCRGSMFCCGNTTSGTEQVYTWRCWGSLNVKETQVQGLSQIHSSFRGFTPLHFLPIKVSFVRGLCFYAIDSLMVLYRANTPFQNFAHSSASAMTVTQDHFYSINETEDHGISYYVYHTILRIAIPCNTTQYNIIWESFLTKHNAILWAPYFHWRRCWHW